MESVSGNRSPFDFDEADDKDEPTQRSPFFKKLLRFCIVVAIISFFVALIGSVIGNNATGDRQLESLAFALNRWGAFVMLLGCFGIFIGLRGPQLQRLSAFRPGPRSQRSPWWTLFVCSVIGWFALVGVLFGLALFFGNGAIVLVSALVPVAVPLFLTMALWHTGIVRAYAIGFLVCLAIGLLSAVPLIWSFGFSALWMSTGNMYGYSPYPYNTTPTYGPGDVQWSMVNAALGQLFLAALSGLVCSGYVACFERFSAAPAKRESDELPR